MCEVFTISLGVEITDDPSVAITVPTERAAEWRERVRRWLDEII